ncbi:MBL fold metallo-hydrolase [Fodinibius sediminis]|uniref:Phosphoribosyl 1,2-cyclic phosphodiesterase n=1 Tax=Fodinibius sediminis TaxID=1214077 RepID=A0A521AG07_9BACT|nr:MBL fold metallo-hydrolase [Fodinibius sediminis]SMO33763.1 Phosphoribosyl 1,2-cyclic phosphodiesterase [Fodinibius sediminis]
MSDRLSGTCVFWGVRGSTPCADRENMDYGGNTTCLQVELPGTEEVLIFDSGTGIRKLGQYLHERHERLKGRIFITHPHWDHIQGFPFFKPLHQADNQFHIHMPVQQEGSCREIMSGHFGKTFFPVPLDTLDACLNFVDQQPERAAFGAYEVEYLKAIHGTNTAMYKLHIGGRQMVFAPDNELVPEKYRDSNRRMESIAKFIRGVDLLIHDAQYDLEAYEHRRGWGHSPWQEVVRLAREQQVRKLYLTHHDPEAHDRKLQQLDEYLRENYGSYFEVIKLAREGQTEKI